MSVSFPAGQLECGCRWEIDFPLDAPQRLSVSLVEVCDADFGALRASMGRAFGRKEEENERRFLRTGWTCEFDGTNWVVRDDSGKMVDIKDMRVKAIRVAMKVWDIYHEASLISANAETESLVR